MIISRIRKTSVFSIDGFLFRDGRMPTIFLLLLFGLFIGSMASSYFFSGFLLSKAIYKSLLDTLFIIIVLLFSTSLIGFILIPLLVVAWGFIFSVLLSSACYFSDGFILALVREALPSLFFLPCLFVLADDSLQLSFSLLKRSAHRCYPRHFFSHVLLCLIPLIAEFLYCSYVVPLIIN